MSAQERNKGPAATVGGVSGDGPADTVRGFLKRGEAFIEEILRDNEMLRLRVVQLESKPQDARTPVPAPVAADELRGIFEELRREHEELRRRLDEVAEETEQYKNRYQQIEEENDRLVNLFVSAHQLHSSLEFSEVVQIIVEILLNFVGASRFALLLWDAPSGRFRAIESYGIPLAEVPELDRDAPPVAACLDSRRPVVQEPAGRDWDPQRPQVCLPLLLGEEVVGLATVYSYLEQKEGLSEIDQELFGLLTDRGGVVLEAARVAASALPVESLFEACHRLLHREEGNDA